MKKCYKCDTVKDKSEFHKNRAKVDGLQNYCKSCAKIRNHEYYLSTPEKNPDRRAYHMVAKAAAMNAVWAYLLENSCVDCGEGNPVVLEFDHVKDVKVMAISSMVGAGKPVSAIMDEIAKCEVRCANCHRIQTAKRGNWYATISIPA